MPVINTLFHRLKIPADTQLPRLFTYPFHYTPHPLCLRAATEVQQYLASQSAWAKELQRGKMFGVLVVKSPEGEVGFLAAFSGNLCGTNNLPYFVPPVYDLLSPNSFFPEEERKIDEINAVINRLINHPDYLSHKEKLSQLVRETEIELSAFRQEIREAKRRREERRRQSPSEEEQAAMIRESQFQKAELKRRERKAKEAIHNFQQDINRYEDAINRLKEERHRRSVALQMRLFRAFQMRNALGETRDLCDIFRETPQAIPPAGAGECAAPKLLQYAYLNGFEPLAMAEFWWGNSPKGELRRHGHFYPACRGKCLPILTFMLQGLNVEPDPLTAEAEAEHIPIIIYEDEWLAVVDKPAGMLSVPGKGEACSVQTWARRQFPSATGPLVVHRLDMATSGLLLIAKNKEIHQNLQAQFKNKTVRKRYIALLDGRPAEHEGFISLPLLPDPLDRPRQVVSHEHGKPAITRYEVLAYDDPRPGITRITFYPQTGRTHQLRVHAAHPEGLNAPILGDALYGKPGARLYLHAERLEFIHPATHQSLCIESPAEF